MPAILNRNNVACLLFIAAALTACTTTIKKRKNPVLAVSKDSIAVGLNNLVTAEHFGLDGEDISVNGKDSSVLEIDVINGKHIPGEGDSLKALGFPIAALIKGSLQDKDEYDKYLVCFAKVDSGSLVVKRSWVTYTYPSASLR